MAKEIKTISECLSGQRWAGMLLAIVTSAGETDLDERHFSLTFPAAGRPQASFIYPVTLLDGPQVLRGHGTAVPNQLFQMGQV